jgi:hypothetical protein
MALWCPVYLAPNLSPMILQQCFFILEVRELIHPISQACIRDMVSKCIILTINGIFINPLLVDKASLELDLKHSFGLPFPAFGDFLYCYLNQYASFLATFFLFPPVCTPFASKSFRRSRASRSVVSSLISSVVV